MESEILQTRISRHQHHDHNHPSSIDDRVEKVFGHLREEFQGELSVENLGLKIEDYGTFLPTQLIKYPSSNSATENQIPNSSDLEKRIEKLFGRFRQNFIHKENLGPQFNCYGTFLSASNAASENHSRKLVLLNSIPASNRLHSIAQKLVEPVRPAAVPPKVNTINIRIAKRKRESNMELEESPSKILKSMTSYPLSGKPMVSPLNRNLFNIKSMQTGMEKARSPLLQSKDDQKTVDIKRQSELRATDHATKEGKKSAIARPRIAVKIKNRNRSRVAEEVRGNTNRDATGSDGWVRCYKCHKRRLLPCWIDYKELTIKWSCSQINWLAPGMNNCELNERKYNAAVNNTTRRDPPSRNKTSTKRPSSKISESKLCPNDMITTRITNKRRAIRTKGSTAASILEKASLILTEARDFKCRADRLKKDGQETLSSVLYLEAILKYLEVASLWEHKQVNRKHDAIRLFLQTANLSKHCASQCDDMQARVLYKAMELANKRAALLRGHLKTDCADHQSEIDDFIVRAREAM